MKLLMVDHDPDLLAVTTAGLEGLGFGVMALRDANEALNTLATQDFDVLIADVILPGMSGLELAHRSLRRSRCLKVVLTSGEVHLVYKLPGGMRFLPKPYKFSELIAAIRLVTSE